MKYVTRYPRTVMYEDGTKDTINVDKSGVNGLHIEVKQNIDELIRIFKREGFTGVKFEHKKDSQIGHGMNLKLKKPWEMHIRFIKIKKGMIAIQSEVEISRDYLQHLFCQNTPVTYEIEEVLKKYFIEYKMVSSKLNKYITSVKDNYSIKLDTPNIPVFAWKPIIFVIGSISSLYLWKYLDMVL